MTLWLSPLFAKGNTTQQDRGLLFTSKGHSMYLPQTSKFGNNPSLPSTANATSDECTSLFIPQTEMGTKQLPICTLPSLGISFIRVQWVDLTNTVRYRVLPLSYFYKLLQSRPGVNVTKSAMGLIFDSTIEGFSAIGEYFYAMDLTSLRVCSYAPGHASVLGFFQMKTHSMGKEINAPICPRWTLQRLVRYVQHSNYLTA